MTIAYLVEEVAIGLRTRFAVRKEPVRVKTIEGDWANCDHGRCGIWLLHESVADAQVFADILNEWSEGLSGVSVK